MCNVYRVALIPNGVKKGVTKLVHVVCQACIDHGLKGNVNYWCVALIPSHYQLWQSDTNCCLKSRAAAKWNAYPDVELVWVVKEHLLMEKAEVTWCRGWFFPQWISVVAPPGNKSLFAAISDYIKGHLDLYQCAIHEAWHCNILTAEKMIHSTTILITRSSNISNYVLMDECVIVGGDWDRCAGRSRNQKDPKSRRPREHFPLFM